MDIITARGYMVEVTWDGRTLRAHGTTGASRVALNGKDHEEDVVVPVQAIESVTLKPAGMLVNGNLMVRTVEGRKYQLHFRRKQAGDFQDLYDSLRPFLPA